MKRLFKDSARDFVSLEPLARTQYARDLVFAMQEAKRDFSTHQNISYIRKAAIKKGVKAVFEYAVLAQAGARGVEEIEQANITGAAEVLAGWINILGKGVESGNREIINAVNKAKRGLFISPQERADRRLVASRVLSKKK